jgi:hypothetical protein
MDERRTIKTLLRPRKGVAVGDRLRDGARAGDRIAGTG